MAAVAACLAFPCAIPVNQEVEALDGAALLRVAEYRITCAGFEKL
jgi:hypothetical protein